MSGSSSTISRGMDISYAGRVSTRSTVTSIVTRPGTFVTYCSRLLLSDGGPRDVGADDGKIEVEVIEGQLSEARRLKIDPGLAIWPAAIR